MMYFKHVVKKNKGKKVITSDHNILTASFNVKVDRQTKQTRHEFFDFKMKAANLSFFMSAIPLLS